MGHKLTPVSIKYEVGATLSFPRTVANTTCFGHAGNVHSEISFKVPHYAKIVKASPHITHSIYPFPTNETSKQGISSLGRRRLEDINSGRTNNVTAANMSTRGLAKTSPLVETLALSTLLLR